MKTRFTLACCRTGLVLIALLAPALVCAQTPLLDDVRTVAVPGAAAPLEYDVAIPLAGSYQVQLTDLGAQLTPPAPLTSVYLAVSFEDALVGQPLVGAGTLTLSAATAGTYRVHITGQPGTGTGSGAIGLQITPSAGGNPVFSTSATFATTSTPPSGILTDTFSVASAGSYTISLNDLAFPQSLGASGGAGGTLTLLLIQASSSTPVLILPDPTNNNALQAQLTLQPGDYKLFAIGQSVSGTPGLYNVTASPGLYSRNVPVGGTSLLGSPSLNQGPGTLSVTDLAFPASLTQVSAIVASGAQVLAQASGAGSTPLSIPNGGTYQVFAYATASDAGSFVVQVADSSGATALRAARVVTASTSLLSGYTFDTSVASPGMYAVGLQDFQFPSTLASVSLAVSQGASLVASPLAASGTLAVNAAAGPITLLVFAQPAAGIGGLLDANITDSTGQLMFDSTQAVGVAFMAKEVSITSTGTYTVSATDLQFPEAFSSFEVAVTQAGTLVGEIFGGGEFAFQAKKPGNYAINLLATPGSKTGAGTYALTVAPAPPAPTVNLSADATSVPSGQTVHLMWMTLNATSCAGSGGGWSSIWTGAQAVSNSVTSPAITANTTFTLTCQGLGGSNASSVTINLGSAHKGGGGALDWLTPIALMGLVSRRLRSRRLRWSRLRRPVLAFFAAAGLTLGWAWCAEAGASDTTRVLANVGKQAVTEADVITAAKSLFDEQDQQFHRSLRRLESAYALARHQLLQNQLDKQLDERALQLEAKQRGVSQEKLVGDIKIEAVSDAEVRAFYDVNKSRTTETLEQLEPRIRQHLEGAHRDESTRAFYDHLRAKHSIVSHMDPYRVQVADTGPSRGREDAPVTIVEFGDFQCPYCQQEEAVLGSILNTYQGKVKLVFRHLPLTSIHPDALTAAKAAVCGERQGKFWDMHDAMYADQRALALDSLKATAARLGLDGKRFEDCLSDAQTAQRIATDVQAADDLGIGATPAFFINGRPIEGSVPADQLITIIAEELRRSAQVRG